MLEKILFIDDDAICTFINASLVEEMGMAKEVISLPGAAEALQYIKQHHYTGNAANQGTAPDLIFLDLKNAWD